MERGLHADDSIDGPIGDRQLGGVSGHGSSRGLPELLPARPELPLGDVDRHQPTRADYLGDGNLAQCEGLPPELAIVAPPPAPGLILPQVEALITATGVDFRIGGSRAFYMPDAGLHAGAATASLFRADQLAPDRPS